MKKHTVTLVFVARNEEVGVRTLLPRVPFYAFEQCFAVDGQSRDHTAEAFAQHRVPVFAQQEKGLGAAMLEARARIKTDSFVFFHPDGNEDPDDLSRVADLLRAGHDFVVASRMLPGAWNEEDDRWLKPRKYANKGLAMLANLFFSQADNGTTDVTNGLRGITCAAFDRMGLSARDLTMDYQMVIRALKRNIPITEFPTREGKRIHGKTNFPSLFTGFAEMKLLVRELFCTDSPAVDSLAETPARRAA